MQNSVTVRNAKLAARETAIGTAPVLRIFGGAAMPGACATADAGTVLSEMTLPSDWQGAPSAGAVAIAGSWADASADANGYARYFRIYDSAVANCHEQGLCSQAWAASSPFVLNQHANNGGNVYLCTTAGTSAGSGGPTGTGTGITDGSCVWSYVGAVDMVLVNTSIAATQPVSITSYTVTEGGA
jgi:hypothetical protein